jgi:hypothetical protein
LQARLFGGAARLLAHATEVGNIAALGHADIGQTHLTYGTNFAAALLTHTCVDGITAIIGAATRSKQHTERQGSKKPTVDNSSHDAALYCTGG